MKNIFIMFVLIFLAFTSVQLYASSFMDIGSTDSFTFPISVDSDAWKNMQSATARLESCTIPINVLETISTRGLVQSCIDFPFAMNIYAHDTIKKGADRVISTFNGLRELLSRKDVGFELVRAYRLFPAKNIDPNWSLEEKGKYTLYLGYLEMLLSRPEVLLNIEEPALKNLLDYCLANYKAKVDQPDIYGGITLYTSAFLMANIMNKLKYEKFLDKLKSNTDIQMFLKTSQSNNSDILTIISSLSSNLLTEGGK